jgi:hypothetical protein
MSGSGGYGGGSSSGGWGSGGGSGSSGNWGSTGGSGESGGSWGSSGGSGTSGNWGSTGGSNRGQHTGRGPKNYQRSDDRIREDVCERLTRNGEIDATEIEVEVKNGEVTLTGTVEDRSWKRIAEDTIEDVPGVKDIHNQLRASQTRSESGGSSSKSSLSSTQSTGSNQSAGSSQSTGGTQSTGGSSSTSSMSSSNNEKGKSK